MSRTVSRTAFLSLCVVLTAGCLEVPTPIEGDDGGASLDGAVGSLDQTVAPDGAESSLEDGALDASVELDGPPPDRPPMVLGCNPGSRTPCGSTTGECEEGQQYCLENRTWSACEGAVSPATQGCEGLDEDCDDSIDEGCECEVGARRPCGTEVGTCEMGEQICGASGWGACDGVGPAVETCDGLDTDCDGVTDEGQSDQIIECGRGACRAQGQRTCVAGAWFDECLPAAAVSELCNGHDDDCDGAVDEVGDQPCAVGVGGCERAGVHVCSGAVLECTAVAGQPGDEICNTVDDDCDGIVDEGVPGLGAVCSDGSGPCRVEGEVVCGPDGPVCSAVAGQGGGEICNGIDDDCNGQVDDGVTDAGSPCSAGVGACLEQGQEVCRDGALTCSVTGSAPGVETCNGVDDDCDGATDNVPGLGAACSQGQGGCRRDGQRICGGGALMCNAVAGNPVAETCNGVDSNCDGQIDNVPGSGEACSVGVGACRRSGERVCSGGALVCSASPAGGSAETCNGIDDDCDGTTDEVAGLGGDCTVGVGACARNGTRQCGDGALVCSASAGPSGVESCNGVDDDCDGNTDEGFNVGGNCSVGRGICRRSGHFECVNGASECDAVPGEPEFEECLGLDQDCDGRIDEHPRCDGKIPR